MSVTWFCVTILFLRVSQCAARADFFNNGKLSSGHTYWGNSYQHILVEEGDKYHNSDQGNWFSSGRDRCFRLYMTRTRISSKYIIDVLLAIDRAECETQCLRTRECRGFNYRYRAAGTSQFRDNCELSSGSSSSAGRTAFYSDNDYDFYERTSENHNIQCDNHDHLSSESQHYGNAWGNFGYDNNYGGGSEFREDCFRRAEIQSRPYDRAVRESVWTDNIYDCMEKCHYARNFDCLSFGFGYISGSGRYQRNCLLSDREYRSFYDDDFIPDRDFDFFERRIYDRECGIDSNDYGTGRSITVNGAKCYRGSCIKDTDGHYWFCKLDGSGEAWDYCCAPEEYCSHSGDSQEPWCVVGYGQYKWRPCKMEFNRAYLQDASSRLLPTNLTSLELEEYDIIMNETFSVPPKWNDSGFYDLAELPEYH